MAAACGSLDHIFDKPLPDNPTLLESLSSWKQIRSINPVQDSSFTEIFGELYVKESPLHSSSPVSTCSSSFSPVSSPFPEIRPIGFGIDIPRRDNSNGISTISTPHVEKNKFCIKNQRDQYRNREIFSSMNSESLSLCTEGLGFESSDDVEDLLVKDEEICSDQSRNRDERRNKSELLMKRSRTSRNELPPPISCIGRSGKPWVCFKSYRENGRFILKEIKIPTQEFLHAWREDGRLKLRFIHSESDDEIFEDDDDDKDEVIVADEGDVVKDVICDNVDEKKLV